MARTPSRADAAGSTRANGHAGPGQTISLHRLGEQPRRDFHPGTHGLYPTGFDEQHRGRLLPDGYVSIHDRGTVDDLDDQSAQRRRIGAERLARVVHRRRDGISERNDDFGHDHVGGAC